MEREWKKFHKKSIFYCIFSIIKSVFQYMFAKFSYLIRPHAISSTRSQILRCMGTRYLLGNELEQQFLIHFEACIPLGRKNYFHTPCTIFIKKENKHRIQ